MKNTLETALSELDSFLGEEPRERARVLQYLRDTPLPFICSYLDALTPAERFHYSFRYLHVLGRHNVALAVGLLMSQYMVCSVSCIPVGSLPDLEARKVSFLQGLKDQRWLLAVSSTDDWVRHKAEQPRYVDCRTQEDGSVVCNGTKNFQSNVSSSDLLMFAGVLDGDHLGMFITPLSAPGIRLKEPLFGGWMADSDTRSVVLEDVVVPPSGVLIGHDAQDMVLPLHAMTRVVFSVMGMAPYMGGALRALEEACRFLDGVHVDGEPLSSLDGMVTDLGRARIKYQVCADLVERFEAHMEGLDADTLPRWLEEEAPKAFALKYHVTAVCEELVDLSRKLIGTRAMMPSHIIRRLSDQIRFGALHPVIGAKIERDAGVSLLASARGGAE